LPGDGSAAIIAHIRTDAGMPPGTRAAPGAALADRRGGGEPPELGGSRPRAGWEDKPFDLRDIPAYNVRCRSLERFKQPVQYPHSRSYQIPLFFVLMFPRYGTRSVAFNRA